MRKLATLVAALITSSALAGLIPDDRRDALIENVLKNFWGKAKDSRGEFIQPASEEERRTLPVTKAIAYHALDAGEVSGIAEWCGLDWKPHYFSLTKAAREQAMNDKQVAFISFLHGSAQGSIQRAMQGKACDEQTRARATGWLKDSSAKQRTK